MGSPGAGKVSLGDALADARRRMIARRIELESRLVKAGWMVKQGHKFKTWKRRYFVLQGFELSYYRKGPSPSSDGAAGTSLAGVIDIREFTLEEAHVARSSLCMRLVAKRMVDSEFLMYCENEADFVGWVKGISLTMRDFTELEEQSMELQGATVRASVAGGGVTYSLLGGH